MSESQSFVNSAASDNGGFCFWEIRQGFFFICLLLINKVA